ncbi:MAG: peptidylprolyl isomerase [Acidobacteriota bacterium]
MQLKRAICCVAMILGAAALHAQLLQPNGDAVVAVVNGKNVTRADIDKIKQIAPPQLLQILQANPQAALLNWYLIQYLGDLGQQRKLDERSPFKEQFQAMKSEALAQAVVGDESNTYPVPAADIKAFYDQHKTEYQQSKIKAIYVSYKPQISGAGTSPAELEAAAKAALLGGKREEPDALRLAIDLVQKLRAGGDFAKLAAEFSDDADSKTKGGDFGVIKGTSQFPEDFKKIVLDMKEGAISDPIKQPAGYYVVRVEEKAERSMTDMNSEIVASIRDTHTKQWLVDLQKQFQPEIKDPSYFMQPGLQGIQQHLQQTTGQK